MGPSSRPSVSADLTATSAAVQTLQAVMLSVFFPDRSVGRMFRRRCTAAFIAEKRKTSTYDKKSGASSLTANDRDGDANQDFRSLLQKSDYIEHSW